MKTAPVEGYQETTVREATEQAKMSREKDIDEQKLAQRMAIVMTQTRAREDRHLATGLMVKVGTPAAQAFARELFERSHMLEALALDWAETWPPKAPEKPGPQLVVQ